MEMGRVVPVAPNPTEHFGTGLGLSEAYGGMMLSTMDTGTPHQPQGALCVPRGAMAPVLA